MFYVCVHTRYIYESFPLAWQQWNQEQSRPWLLQMLQLPRDTGSKRKIVIRGMGLMSIFGSKIYAFYNKFLESGISLIDESDASIFSV